MKSAPRTYTQVVVGAGLEAAFCGVWVAAGGLPTARRRAARAGLVAVALATSGAFSRLGQGSTEDEVTYAADSPDDELSAGQPSSRQLAMLAGGVAFCAASVFGGRRLEKYWLARLTANGHPHPHRALGKRLAAVSLAVNVPTRIIEVRAARRDT